MTDLRTRLREADRMAAPDLWPHILTREPRGEPPPRFPWGQAATIAFAVGVAALAVLVLIRVLPLGGVKPGGPSPTRPAPVISSSSSPSPSTAPTLPPAVLSATDFPVPADLMTAADGSLFSGRASSSQKALILVRIAADGTRTRATIPDHLAYYMGPMAATGTAVYVGTDVIGRFTDAKDELVRVDASTLRLTKRITLPANVGPLVTDGASLWGAVGDRVVRFDPVSLAERAAVVIPGLDLAPSGSGLIFSMSKGSTGLWVAAGNADRAFLYRLDPVGLAIRSRTRVPGGPEQGLSVVASSRAVWWIGPTGVRRVDPATGSFQRLVTVEGGLESAVAREDGLVLFLGDLHSIALTDARGRIVARSDELGDLGSGMRLDGRSLWMNRGLGIVRFVLADVPLGT